MSAIMSWPTRISEEEEEEKARERRRREKGRGGGEVSFFTPILVLFPLTVDGHQDHSLPVFFVSLNLVLHIIRDLNAVLSHPHSVSNQDLETIGPVNLPLSLSLSLSHTHTV